MGLLQCEIGLSKRSRIHIFGYPSKAGIESTTQAAQLIWPIWQYWLSCLAGGLYTPFARISRRTYSGPSLQCSFTIGLDFLTDSCFAYCGQNMYSNNMLCIKRKMTQGGVNCFLKMVYKELIDSYLLTPIKSNDLIDIKLLIEYQMKQ